MGYFASPVFWEIQFLVESLNKKSYIAIAKEVQDLAELYGHDASMFALSCLLRDVDLRAVTDEDVVPSKFGESESKLMLARELSNRMWKENRRSFGAGLRTGLEGAVALVQQERKTPVRGPQRERLAVVNADQVEMMCRKGLQMTTMQLLAVGVGLAQSSEKHVADEGAKFLAAVLFGLMDSSADDEIDVETISEVVWVLRSHATFVADADLGSSCLLALEGCFPGAFKSVEVAPFLVEDSLCVNLLDGSEALPTIPQLDSLGVVQTLSIDGFLQDLGPTCMKTVAGLRKILSHLVAERGTKLNEVDVASVLGMMAKTQSHFLRNGTHSSPELLDVIANIEYEFGKEKSVKGNTPSGNGGTPTGWDVGVFIEVARDLTQGSINAKSVVRKIADVCSNLSVEKLDKAGFDVIVNAYKFMDGGKQLPGLLLVDTTGPAGTLWANKATQMALLFHAVNASPDDVLFNSSAAGRPTISVARGVATSPNGAWESLDVVATLDGLAGSGFYHHVKHLFDEALNFYPELLLLGLLQVNSPFDTLREEIYAVLLPKFLLSIHQNQEPMALKIATVRQIWETNHYVLLRALVAMYARDAKFLPFIVDIARQQEDGITKLLSLPMPRLVYDAACFASRRDPPLLNLEKWLFDKLQTSQQQGTAALQTFARTLLFILQLKTNPQQQQNANLPLLPEELQAMFRCLQTMIQSRGLLPQDVLNEANPMFMRVAQMASAASAASAGGSGGVNEHQSSSNGLGTQASGGSTPPPPPPGVDGKPQAETSPSPTLPQQSKSPSPEYVEQQANTFLQAIYKSPKSTQEIVDLLKKLKNSENQLEQDIFNCMVHNLLDEYRFLHKYPDKELQITGVLFGALIQHQLLSSMALGIALRYVLEALRKPASTPMFRFGMFALEHFKGRLVEWPQTAVQVVKIPHLRERNPELVRSLETKLNISQLASFPATDVATSVVAAKSASTTALGLNEPYPLRGTERLDDISSSFFSRLDELVHSPDTLGDAVEPPSSEIEDKITFVINNLTQRNMEEKVQQAKQLLKPEFSEWVAYYLVAKRVSTQANFHAVYMTFLDMIGDKQLLEDVRFRTLFTVRKLLRSNDIVSSTTERSLLKHLGSWLGRLTLAKNKPLLHREVDLKGLLLDGYERGWLIAVVPFAAKVLDGTKGTTVFTPNNPWLMGILSSLAELYHLEELKLNLKFEIEVLCKALGIDLKVIPPANLLRTRRKPKLEGNPDFNFKAPEPAKRTPAPPSPGLQRQQPGIGGQPPHIDLQVPGGVQPQPGGQGQAKGRETEGKLGDIPDQTVIPNLASYVYINPNLQLFQQNQSLRRVVPVAVDRAIREIIQPVVERSVTIACITSKELVTKDFAMEPDEKKMRKAAHLMVSNLAGALALVTCKEPLRVSIGNHLRTLLAMANTRDEQSLVEQVVQNCANDNLELGCMLIEKAATEKAIRDIDEQIDGQLAIRQEAREKHGQPYFDMSIFNSNSQYPNALPDHLRPSANPNGLPSHQLLVYEAFQRSTRQPMMPPNRASVGNAGPGTGLKQGGSNAANLTGAAPNPPNKGLMGRSGSPAGGTLSAAQGMEKLRACLLQLDRAAQDLITQSPAPVTSLSRLPKDHEILVHLLEIRNIGAAIQPEHRQEAAMSTVQNCFKRLYEIQPTDKINMEIQLSVLTILRDLMKDPMMFKKNLTEWVIYAPAEHLLNRSATCGLIRNKLIVLQDFDVFLGKLLDTRQHPVIQFAMDIIQECVVMGRFVLVTEMLTTLDSLQKLLLARNKSGPQGQPDIPGLQQLLENVKMIATGEQQPQQQQQQQPQQQQQQQHVGMFLRSETVPGMRQQVMQLLQAWIQLCNRPDGVAHEGTHRPYLSLLQQQGALKGDENALRFFRITTELCIESSLTQNVTNSPQRSQGRKVLSYVAIDAFSKLVVLLVKYAEVRSRTSLVSMVLEVIAGVLCREFLLRKQRGLEAGLDQRPYFRLLLNLQQDLTESLEAEGLGDEHVLSMLSVFADIYDRVLQPRILPNFAFAWLELISNKSFMPRLLRGSDGKGWLILEHLLVDLLQFLYPFLKEIQLPASVRLLYKGTLRVLLVLLHDFPEFLCSFHFSLCDAIPPSCIQLRNLILSAFPRSMQLPDPFTPNLKVDALPEAQATPNILSQYQNALAEFEIKQDLDNYLKSGQPVKFLADLKDRLVVTDSASGKRDFNLPLINALVLYAGMYSIAQLKNLRSQPQNAKLTLMQLLSQSSSMTSIALFEHLINDMDPEGRYLCLNAFANQLRFPSSHTHFFSCVLLHLFQEARSDLVREQITRVLLERLIVHRPHPWGLLVTFIELIKNEKYRFWDYSFTKCAPEIDRLFESVSRSCMSTGSSGQGAQDGSPASLVQGAN